MLNSRQFAELGNRITANQLVLRETTSLDIDDDYCPQVICIDDHIYSGSKSCYFKDEKELSPDEFVVVGGLALYLEKYFLLFSPSLFNNPANAGCTITFRVRSSDCYAIYRYKSDFSYHYEKGQYRFILDPHVLDAIIHLKLFKFFVKVRSLFYYRSGFCTDVLNDFVRYAREISSDRTYWSPAISFLGTHQGNKALYFVRPIPLEDLIGSRVVRSFVKSWVEYFPGTIAFQKPRDILYEYLHDQRGDDALASFSSYCIANGIFDYRYGKVFFCDYEPSEFRVHVRWT